LDTVFIYYFTFLIKIQVYLNNLYNIENQDHSIII